MRLSRRRPSPSLVISIAALFVALGGTTYAATGGNFLLGKPNSATSATALTSNNAGEALSVTQQSAAAGATALGLNVPSNRAPFTVNSSTKVVKLNADKLDGVDSTGFLRNQVPLNLSGSDATAALGATNTGAGNGLQGITSSSTASGVYGQNGGGGIGVAGRSNQPGGVGVLGEATGANGIAGQFNGPLQLNGALQCFACVSAGNIDGKVYDSYRLDGIDASGFVQGGGNAVGQAVAAAQGTDLFLGPPIGGFLRFSVDCSGPIGANGFFQVYNDSGGPANVFVDSGGGNPTYYPMTAGQRLDLASAAAGDSYLIQAQGGPGVLTVLAATVKRQASNDCHAQAQGVLTH